MGSAMAARPARRDEVTAGDLAEGDKATAAGTKNTGSAAAPVTRRRMQRRKAKHKSKTSGPGGGKAHGGVTLLNEPFTPKDSGKPRSAAWFSCLLAKLPLPLPSILGNPTT